MGASAVSAGLLTGEGRRQAGGPSRRGPRRPDAGDDAYRLDPWRRLGGCDFVVDDLESLEKCLVEHAPDNVGRGLVGVAGCVEETQRFLHGGSDVVGAAVGRLCPLHQLGAFAPDARLFEREHVLVDQFAVGKVEQPLLFLLEFFEASRRAIGFFARYFELSSGVALDRGADALLLSGGQPDEVLVVALDGAFDGVDGEVAGAALDATSPAVGLAAEVFICAAVAFGAQVDEPAAALGAVDAALEVVLVFAGAIAAQLSGVQNFLDALEGLGGDERRVQAGGVLDAVVGDDTDVVVIAQHPMYCAASEGGRWPLGGHRGLQSGGVEHVRNGRHRVLAGGVGLKRHLHQRGALGVDLNGAYVAAVDALAHVDVADRSLARRAAHGVLALEAHLDLLGITGRAELIDGCQHAMRQPTAGGLVDVLQYRYELGPGLLNLHHKQRVIKAVSGQARQVVDDHVVRPQLLDLGQHPPQRRTVCRTAADAVLDVLLDDLRAERARAARSGFALAGDGIALRVGAADLAGA